MQRFTVDGFDPHPGGAHGVRSLWVIWPDGEVQLESVRPLHDEFDAGDGHHKVAIEDPCGVLFSKTNSLLWSMTAFQAGVLAGSIAGREVMVRPMEARRFLAGLAGVQSVPTKDAEVRQLLMAVYGLDCFDSGKACRKRNNKSHNENCPLCNGTGLERQAQPLADLTSAHLRDAFVVAQFVAHGGVE